jgi:hypothetical protein
MSSNQSEKPQEIYTILLLDANLRCTCDDVIRDESITQARGHYHHCMLWQVTRAIDISLRISEGHKFVYLSKTSGKFVK